MCTTYIAQWAAGGTASFILLILWTHIKISVVDHHTGSPVTIMHLMNVFYSGGDIV